MNVFRYVLSKTNISSSPALARSKFVVDDTIGESVHIHYRNLRLAFEAAEYDRFADGVEEAVTRLESPDELDHLRWGS